MASLNSAEEIKKSDEGAAGPNTESVVAIADSRAAGDESTTAGDEPTTADSDQKEDKKKKKKKKKKKNNGKDKGLGSSRGVETMFRVAYRTHLDLTSLADAKANMMISINGLILSIIIASIAPKIDSNPWLLLPTAVILISCLIAIVYAVLAARPRVISSQVNVDDIVQNKGNLLFFGNYKGLEIDEFVRGMSTLVADRDLLYVNMMRDLYGIGSVLDKKFRLLRTSYTVFMVGITVSVLLFIFVFVLMVPTQTVP